MPRLAAHSTPDIVTDLDMPGFPPGKCFPRAATRCWRFAGNRHVIASMLLPVMRSISAQNDAKWQGRLSFCDLELQSLKRRRNPYKEGFASFLQQTCQLRNAPQALPFQHLQPASPAAAAGKTVPPVTASGRDDESPIAASAAALPSSSGPAFPARHGARSRSCF